MSGTDKVHLNDSQLMWQSRNSKNIEYDCTGIDPEMLTPDPHKALT